MQKRLKKSASANPDFKQNLPNNVIQHQFSHPKLSKKCQSQAPTIHSSTHHFVSQAHKKPVQLSQIRHLCQQQQRQVLSEYRSNRMFHYSQFYEYVQMELQGSEICEQILNIKMMSNEEAQEEMMRVQECGKWKNHSEMMSRQMSEQRQAQFLQQQKQQEAVTIFKHCVKKVSMIEENDDIYLEELGEVGYQLEQEQHENQGDVDEEYREMLQSESYSRCQATYQYYQNDDVFEF